MVKKSNNENQNLLSFLSYLFGPVPIISQSVAILLIITNRKNNHIGFHAIQSLIFFTVIQIMIFILTASIIGIVLIPFILIAEFVLWIVFIWKALKGDLFKLPVIGTISEKQLRKYK